MEYNQIVILKERIDDMARYRFNIANKDELLQGKNIRYVARMLYKSDAYMSMIFNGKYDCKRHVAKNILRVCDIDESLIDYYFDTIDEDVANKIRFDTNVMRIYQFRKEKKKELLCGRSIKNVAVVLGIPYDAFRDVLKGVRIVDDDLVEKIMNTLCEGVNDVKEYFYEYEAHKDEYE